MIRPFKEYAMLKVNVSIGEVIDKISILEIKLEKLASEDSRSNVEKELTLLLDAITGSTYAAATAYGEAQELRVVNSSLWLVEDELREKESEKNFDDQFIELARSVYQLNDRRAELKRVINEKSGSVLIEEKSYAQYT